MRCPARLMHVNLYFTLPYDFDGTFGDAMLLAANHFKQAQKRRAVHGHRSKRDIWAQFLDDVQKGHRLSMEYCVAVLADGRYKVLAEKRDGRFRWPKKNRTS